MVRCLRSGLLAAALGACGEEDARGLAGEGLRLPEAAGGVKEGLHLRRHHAEPCREAEQDAVGLGQLARRDDGVVLTPRRRSILAPRLMLRMDLCPSSFLLVFLLEAVVATARPTSISRHHL